tara:strand:- start:36 stop:617 length:582 start_codon:yes stop_codon:yes gene_type:complete
MIQAAAPFILPIAEALGLSVATLGMAKVTDEVNKYIQENPEQAQKLIATIMPAQGIASMFENKKRGIGDNNPPSPIKEKKPPQEEPPEDPDLLPEIAIDLTLEKIRSDVKFKPSKYANTTDVYYKGKKYAEIEKRTDVGKERGLSDYYLKYPSGTFLEDGEEIFTTEDAWLGFNNAKDVLTQGIYNDLKRKIK